MVLTKNVKAIMISKGIKDNLLSNEYLLETYSVVRTWYTVGDLYLFIFYLFICNTFITCSQRNEIRNTYNMWWGGIQQS